MLAFDIETTGLKPDRHEITIVCTEDFATGKRTAYEFGRLKVAGDNKGYENAKQQMLHDLTMATTLCAFNGLAFDIPFIHKFFSVDNAVVAEWKRKLSDIFVHCKNAYMHTFSLNLLCEKNNVPVKISSGLQAVEWAREHNWDSLLEYCTADVAILNNLYRKRYLLNPRNNAIMDLKFIAREPLYASDPQPLATAHASVDAFGASVTPSKPVVDSWDTSSPRAAAAPATLPLDEGTDPGPGVGKRPGHAATHTRQRMNLTAS